MSTTAALTPPIKSFTSDDVAGMTKAIHEDGFAFVPGVLTPEEVASARAKIDALTPFGFDAQGATDHYKCVFKPRTPSGSRFLTVPA